MKSRYIVLLLIVISLSVVYYFVSYQIKAKPVDSKQPEHSLQGAVNKTIELEGVATDAKAGAMLLVENEPVYIEGLDRWSKSFIDKKVSISGKLVVKTFIPQAEVGKNGEISQGGSGDEDYVLEGVDVGKYK